MEDEVKDGWRCPCCESILSPATNVCIFCSPMFNIVMKAMNPDEHARIEAYHDCPNVRASLRREAAAGKPAKK